MRASSEQERAPQTMTDVIGAIMCVGRGRAKRAKILKESAIHFRCRVCYEVVRMMGTRTETGTERQDDTGKKYCAHIIKKNVYCL